jgi:hypothetical protein
MEKKIITLEQIETPIKSLKLRKRSIDSYVKRLDDNGCKGEFVDMYKRIQENFKNAIDILESHK